MLIEKNAQYYLKRTRAFAKEIEFDIPEELRAQKDINIPWWLELCFCCCRAFDGCDQRLALFPRGV